MKKINKVLCAILLVFMVCGVGYINKPSVEVKNEIVLGDGLHPFPGYNLKYAPNYYDANVKEMQTQLNHYSDSTYCGTPDGYFGDNTLRAVKIFQALEGLTVDGIVGRITWDRLFSN